MNRRLYRSRESRLIGGVCGGLGEYFELDPTLIRIITLLLFLLPGFGILSYLIAWIIIPLRPLEMAVPQPEHKLSPWNKYLPGLILICIGILMLAREYWYWFDFHDVWPLFLIFIGLAIIFWGVFKKDKVRHGEINGHHFKINGEN
ncbi:MAG: PspC domain-containing protein [candidate division Zixibacteria bacterium]|nr:PspC domain-containing protein [candidate division Zixibacteria bacterium]MDD5426550.1 PspC domain-containing protein [candidate division Zixibacteria bacterium]